MKSSRYELVLKQISALIAGETDETAVLANVSSALATAFPEWLWTGFYLVRNGELLLGPFQGPVACYHIKKGRGVCGSSWEREETIVVPDVEEFPGHIACSSLSRSEIVVPMYSKKGDIVGVLDIDSPEIGTFDHIDKQYLEQLVSVLKDIL
ncbi:MAG: GAF domain-containing protein [Prevotellaceae bacterium]|nr:GAF domain-containing protein [Prevotellaceae bacterium]